MTFRHLAITFLLLALAGLALGTLKNPDFWFSADHRGERLMAEKQYKEAARTFTDPWRIAVAEYRDGEFTVAGPAFARVPGAEGAFDQGNAWLMHGAYDDAIKSYDRALGFRPGWAEAEDNKALAIARQKVIEDAGENRDQESANAYDPDEIVQDLKGDDTKGEEKDLNSQQLSNADLRATWLRQVQTSPGDFLRAKFAYQAANTEPADSTAETEGGQ